MLMCFQKIRKIGRGYSMKIRNKNGKRPLRKLLSGRFCLSNHSTNFFSSCKSKFSSCFDDGGPLVKFVNVLFVLMKSAA